MNSWSTMPGEIFWISLKLGLTSFGGPVAHLGYYQRTYVRKLRWLSAEQYGDLVALCQLLPGPTSSQIGFLIGLHRAGWAGAIAVWAGFTLPSALLMYGAALAAPKTQGAYMQAVVHGLMLTAVIVVAQAVWSMARTLAPDLARRLIALAACGILLFEHSGFAQLAVLAGGALAGSFIRSSESRAAPDIPRRPNTRAAWTALALFVAFLAGLSGAAMLDPHGPIALASIFYRSGAFVFGGGHVVLPLLQQALVPTGWLPEDQFLAGYGFVQAMPGPLFTLAAYLGAASAPPHASLLWAALALVSIFLPGLLLAVSGVALLGRVVRHRAASSLLAGVNAAVVGLLAAALYNPVWINAVHSWADVAIALAGLLVLLRLEWPPSLLAAGCVVLSLVEALLV